MPRSSRQKQKILYLARYLLEETDEEKPATLEELIRYLGHQGISAERKSLYADIEELRSFGLDVICTRSKRVGYFIGDRTFQPSEVRLLVDAVQSSRFLTRKKSEALIRKLQTLVSRREAKEMGHNVYVAGRIKTMNESIYTNVDAIGAATRNGKKLRFRYFDWNTAGERVFRREGGYYTVSPFFLIWDDENYYLVAVEEESGEKRHFRVDKMVNLQPLEEDREGEALFEGHDPAEYEKRTFGMYGGKEERVTLWCHESLAGVFYDRFGGELVTRKAAGGFEVSLPVQISPVFYSWLMGFGDRVRILSPAFVVTEFCDLARRVLGAYEEEKK